MLNHNHLRLFFEGVGILYGFTLISMQVAFGQPEERGQRLGSPTGIGFGELPHRWALAAQVATGQGAAGTGSAGRVHRGG